MKEREFDYEKFTSEAKEVFKGDFLNYGDLPNFWNYFKENLTENEKNEYFSENENLILKIFAALAEELGYDYILLNNGESFYVLKNKKSYQNAENYFGDLLKNNFEFYENLNLFN